MSLAADPSLGFCQPITIDTLREKRPLLDAVDHDRRPNVLVSEICVSNLSVCSLHGILQQGSIFTYQANAAVLTLYFGFAFLLPYLFYYNILKNNSFVSVVIV